MLSKELVNFLITLMICNELFHVYVFPNNKKHWKEATLSMASAFNFVYTYGEDTRRAVDPTGEYLTLT